jgi:hypothetical protein
MNVNLDFLLMEEFPQDTRQQEASEEPLVFEAELCKGCSLRDPKAEGDTYIISAAGDGETTYISATSVERQDAFGKVTRSARLNQGENTIPDVLAAFEDRPGPTPLTGNKVACCALKKLLHGTAYTDESVKIKRV